MDSSQASVIQVLPSPSPRDREIATLAESLHIHEPTSQTIATTQVGIINLLTGHMTTEEDIALYQVIGPDRADPPEPFPGRGFPI
jgi:hypothetical protein